LCPPCGPEQAARLAAAALRDTLDTVAATPAARRVLVLDGDPGRWRRPGLEIIPQRGDGLGERLGNAFADVGAAGLLIGMDTPQVSSELLSEGLAALDRSDAVLGPARDGGYWSVGLRAGGIDAFMGVPMSTARTASHQRRRLHALGMKIHEQRALTDVDTIADAKLVASLVPRSRFARTLRDVL
jgi:hypothetical protein